MGHLRLVAPFREAGIQMILGVENGEIHPERVSLGDVVVIQRHFPINFIEYQRIIEWAHAEEKPIIFDIDDLLFFLPEQHPDRLSHFYTQSLLPMFQAMLDADVITVPTQELKTALQEYNKNVFILPNYLDDHLWHLRFPQIGDNLDETIIIGYMGTESHKPDLAFITPVLLDILHCYPEKVHFHFWGIHPPDELSTFSQVKWTPWYSYCYQDFVEYFQNQKADIFLAPLEDNYFNQCKSPIKFFEYSALGVCGVYSALKPYTDVIKHGKEGMLASTLDEWGNCLVQLIEDNNIRKQMVINAQKLIQEKYLLSTNAIRWRELYQNTINKKHITNEYNRPLRDIIESLNQQITMDFDNLTNRITEEEEQLEGLTNRLIEYEQQIETLKIQLDDHEQEILDYVTSRSWRYTRPFRKLNNIIHQLSRK